MRRFSIFYNDGTVVHGGGEDDELVPVYFSRKWLEAPSDGVCAVKTDSAHVGGTVFSQSEFYFQLPFNFHGKGDIFSSNKIGAYLRQACDFGSLVKFGGWTTYEGYNEAQIKARKDEWTRPQTGKVKEPEEDMDL